MIIITLKNKQNIKKEIRFNTKKNDKKKTVTFYPIKIDDKPINSKSYLTIWGWKRYDNIDNDLQFIHYVKNFMKKLDKQYGEFEIVSLYGTDSYNSFYDELSINN